MNLRYTSEAKTAVEARDEIVRDLERRRDQYIAQAQAPSTRKLKDMRLSRADALGEMIDMWSRVEYTQDQQ